MSSEPPDALAQDAESTPIMKPVGPPVVPMPPVEIDAPRPARTVPRPTPAASASGPLSVRKPAAPPPRSASVEPGSMGDDSAPTERRPLIAPLAEPIDDVPGVEGFLAALAEAQTASTQTSERASVGAEPVSEIGAPKRRSRRTVKTADEAPQSKARTQGDAPPSPVPAEPEAPPAPAISPAAPVVDSPPAATTVAPAISEAAADGGSLAKPTSTPVDEGPKVAPPRPAPPRPRAPAAPQAAAGGSPPAEPAAALEIQAPAPAPTEESDVIRPMRIISIGSSPPPSPEPASLPALAAPPAEAPPAAAPPAPIAATPATAAPAPADHVDDEAGWESAQPSRPPLHASVELETFVAPPPPRMPAMSPPVTAPDSPLPPAPPPKPPAVEEVEAIADEEEPAAAAKGDEILSIPDEELVADRISEVDPISAHDEITVDVDEPDPPPKRPPPPPKRSTSIEPAATPAAAAPVAAIAPTPPVVVTAPPAPPPVSVRQVEAAPAAPPPPPPAVATAAPAAAQTLDLGRKRAKPWWEEIFSDDFIRTLEKVEPKAIRKECDFIEERLGLEKGAVMLDLCCGNGAHAVELASRGYNVVGYDLSLAMLARAQDEALDRGQRINFLQGDVREMAFDEAFDGMYSWSTSFGYFEDDKNLNVLSRIHRGLRKGGIFLLDVINRDYVCPRQPSLVWFEGDGCVCMDEMYVDFFSSRLRVKRTVMFEDGRSRECDYSIRLYGLHELGKMLHETGFKVLEVTGHPSHPGVFFGSESPRIIVLAERG